MDQPESAQAVARQIKNDGNSILAIFFMLRFTN